MPAPNNLHQFITEYISEVHTLYRAGNATEHSYRPVLKKLLEALTKLTATNEPKRIDCGAPDYIITDRDVAVGYVEAKDIPVNLNDKSLKEQFDRYKRSLDNLIITNYLTFRWYIKGELVEQIDIGRETDNKIVALNDQFEKFTEIIRSFAVSRTVNIKTSAELSKQMAAKARLLAGIIEKALDEDIKNKEKKGLKNQYEGFKKYLIDTISTKEFADLYSQTIAYGMFAARINYSGNEAFTREKVAKSIPQTNPFLRKMFGFIADSGLDDRILWVIDALADMFNAVDKDKIYAEIGRYADNDPIIHFYETFLTAYDKKLKKQRGVWYTPQPVVAFIVRAVDDILKTKKDFGISEGLADNKVQILDPATGTGTFLAEVVNQIYTGSKFENNKGMWNNYVNEHLILRLNGFEILMASYAMAHLKIEMLLKETNVTINSKQRLKIYLTNSLEKAHDKHAELHFDNWLTDEANEADSVKNDTPIMVILGNPPYSGESANKGKWIETLMLDYKKEPTGGKLQERNSKWINDDYVKFIRLGQYFIENNKEGILAYINNHGFLDNPTFRGMRWKLLQTFDRIYVLDLHGNSKKKETTPDGGKDENVFDIQQGVSINIFVKTGQKNAGKTAKVFHCDLYGKRAEKYHFLLNNNIKSIAWKELPSTAPDYFFVSKNDDNKEEYEEGFSVQALFPVNSVGIVTAKDTVFINNDKTELIKNIKDYFTINPDEALICKVNYRPFDNKYVYYDAKKLERARENVMQHFLKGENVGLMICRQQKTNGFYHCLIHNNIVESSFVSNKTSEIGYSFPLYLYPESGKLSTDEKRTHNLNQTIVDEIASKLGLTFVEEKEKSKNTFAPIDILDYIYAVLHSPTYRERYKEFLKIDFPRVPYPQDAAQFRALATLGSKLRHLHLLEDVKVPKNTANFPIEGTNEIEKPEYKKNKVFINSTQYFGNIPLSAWTFYIGGYQPAQKWLKDRKGRKLDSDDMQHYQRIIAALCETDKLMKEVDTILQKFK